MDDRAIARWRMRTLRLSGQTYPSPAAVVTGLPAVQAEGQRLGAMMALFRDLDDDELGARRAAGERYGRFLDRDTRVITRSTS